MPIRTTATAANAAAAHTHAERSRTSAVSTRLAPSPSPLSETEVFPEMVVEMIAVGEATGSMGTMLAKIAGFYEDEVDVAVKSLTSLLEPMLMIGLGVTVGGVIIAMHLPIFTVLQHVAN